MTRTRALSTFLLIALLAGLLTGCVSTAPSSESTNPGGTIKAATSRGAASDSLGSDTEPNYETVFPQDSVNRIDIILSVEAWTALQTEMEEQFGAQGSGEGGFRGPDEQNLDNPMPSQAGGQTQGEDIPPRAGGFRSGRPEGGQPGIMPDGNMRGMDFGDTSYVSSMVTFNGETYNSVGFRYSGNSTLQNSWRSGTKKISFRLDFDEFEDQDPATKDQRFYGFKQLSFKSNAMDSSYLREKAAGDIFLAAGVIAPQTAFYEVYVDYGEGPQYFGLYTAVEIVDDSLIQTAFSDDSGNVYKPEGTGAAFVEGTFNEESFEKQTNAKEADWGDIQALFHALHSDLHTSDPAVWRAGLEAVFDVDAFLRWLAVDTIMQNWDTYGTMAHNYYLYYDSADGQLTWIPWDNNMSLSASGGVGGPGGRGARELDLTSVSDQWPLIRYLIDDPTYLAKYQQYLKETIDGAFKPDTLESTFQAYYDLIAPYVEKETEDATQLESLQQFERSLEALIQPAQDRYNAVLEYLGET